MNSSMQLKYLSFFISFFLLAFCAKSQEMVSIKGVAPNYVGKSVKVYAYDDYLSRTRVKLAETEVAIDSTFEMSFYNEEIRKLEVRIGKNYFSLYAQPGAEYDIFVSNKSPNTSVPKEGVQVEFYFFDLPEDDINFEILAFEAELYDFLQENFNARSRASGEFAKSLDEFKEKIAEKYEVDSLSYMRTFIRFSVAELDNLAFKGNRNKYEKYDFYIKPETVWYQNDRYMDYILAYYEKYSSQMPRALNQQFYDAVVRSSPTLVMQVLGKDYALTNLRLREFIMLKMLRDVYYSGQYPETNILTILDSVSTYGLFEANRPIAENLKDRLTDLSSGAKSPFFSVKIGEKSKSIYDYQGRHLYFQFAKEGSSKSEADYTLLKPLFEKYGKAIQVLTVVVKLENSELDESKYIQKHGISWDCAFVDENHPLVKNFKVVSFPFYSLLDAQSYVVSSPALTPRPNNEYETIEKTFYSINKIVEEINQKGK